MSVADDRLKKQNWAPTRMIISPFRASSFLTLPQYYYRIPCFRSPDRILNVLTSSSISKHHVSFFHPSTQPHSRPPIRASLGLSSLPFFPRFLQVILLNPFSSLKTCLMEDFLVELASEIEYLAGIFCSQTPEIIMLIILCSPPPALLPFLSRVIGGQRKTWIDRI